MTIPGDRLDAAVAEAVAGSRDALREVVETIRPIVVRYIRARLGTTERVGLSADDVAQEVCLAAIQALPRYQDQGRPFLAFVYGIAAHKVADAHRAAARNKSDPTDVVPERYSLDVGSRADGHAVRHLGADEQASADPAGETARDPDPAHRRRDCPPRRPPTRSAARPGRSGSPSTAPWPSSRPRSPRQAVRTMPDFGRNSRNDEPSLDAIVAQRPVHRRPGHRQPGGAPGPRRRHVGVHARRMARRDALAAGHRPDHRTRRGRRAAHGAGREAEARPGAQPSRPEHRRRGRRRRAGARWIRRGRARRGTR